MWQVLSVYVVASLGVLSGLDTISGILGLPDWFPSLAMGLLLVGLPIVLATAMVQDRPGEVQSSPGALASKAEEPRREAVLTWSRVGGGGVLALALWGAVALAWLLFAGARSSGAADEVLAAVAAVEQAVERTDWLEAFYAAGRLPRRVPDSVRSDLVAQVSRSVELTSEHRRCDCVLASLCRSGR